jgi:hypothetical protein
MRYRKQTSTGDMVRGQGSLDFYIDEPNAVGQAVKTRLQLNLGSFWRDLNDGLPLFQSIAGRPGSPEYLQSVDTIIQDRIKGTQGVTSIISYESSFNSATRSYRFDATVQTVYSQSTVISGQL